LLAALSLYAFACQFFSESGWRLATGMQLATAVFGFWGGRDNRN
jgi:hypothetical protein